MINVGVRTSAPWYDLRESVLQAVVEEGVTYLGEQAFSYCDEMTKVSLPDSMTEIGAEAFFACSKLSEIDLPVNLLEIGNKAFQGCYTFSEISIPETITTIGEYAFYNCEALTNLVFPDNLTTIGQWSFAYCDGLEEITLPENLVVLGDYAFDSCKGLKKASLPDNLTTLGMYAFRGCDLLETVNIPTGITEIAQNTFDGCTSLSSITLPKNITSVGSSAFYNCSKLTDVSIYSYKCVINNSAFTNCSDNLVIHGIKDSIVQTYAEANDIGFAILQVDCGDDHEWKEEYTIDVEPTCTVDGSKSYHCYICDEINEESVVIIPASHSIEKVAAVEATCISKGNIAYYECTECEAYFLDEAGTKEIELSSTIVDKRDHSYTNYVSDNNASCTEDGTKTAKCDYGCGVTDTQTDDKTMLAHDYGEWEILVAATCDAIGIKQRICADCGDMDQEVIDVLEHTEVIDEAVAPTCTETGFTEGKHCSVCNEVLVTQEVVEAIGHTWSDWEVVTEATYTTAGQKRHTCTACDFRESKEVPVLVATSITLDNTALELPTGNEVTLSATCTPIAPSAGDITWTSSDEAVATVDANGKVTAVGDGTAIITATVGGITATCEVTVITEFKPDAPTNLKAVLSGGHDDVKVTWTASENATGYYVYYKKSTASAWSTAKSTTATSYTIKNLADNVKYDFKVVSYYKSGGNVYFDGAKAATASVMTKKNIAAPSTVKAVLYGYDDVKLTWSKSSGATGYVVYYKIGSGAYKKLKTTTSLTYKAANLSDGVQYTFKVVPYYKNGSTVVGSYYSKTVSITTLKKLNTPTVSKYSSTKVKVAWNNIGGETGYQISQSTSKTGTKIVSTYSTTSGKSKTITATKGKTYYYKVRAYKTVGSKKIYGPWSAVTAYKLK